MRLIAIVVAAFATIWGAVADAITERDAAVASATADRGVQFDPAAECDVATVEALAARHPGVRQFVLMATDGWAATTGTVEVLARGDRGTWLCQRGAQPAMYGRSGTRPLLDRRSGDGTTPAGVFPLAEVTAWDGEVFSMFGNGADPGVLAPYRDVRKVTVFGSARTTTDDPLYEQASAITAAWPEGNP